LPQKPHQKLLVWPLPRHSDFNGLGQPRGIGQRDRVLPEIGLPAQHHRLAVQERLEPHRARDSQHAIRQRNQIVDRRVGNMYPRRRLMIPRQNLNLLQRLVGMRLDIQRAPPLDRNRSLDHFGHFQITPVIARHLEVLRKERQTPWLHHLIPPVGLRKLGQVALHTPGDQSGMKRHRPIAAHRSRIEFP